MFYLIDEEGMRHPALFLLIVILLSHSILNGQETNIPDKNQKLKDILLKAGAYCESVKKAVFNFICNENIKEELYLYNKKTVYKRMDGASLPIMITELKQSKIKEKTYLYDYQLIKKEEDPIEKRILLKENGKKKHEENAELKLQRILVKYLVYGPIGFLSNYWQDYFNYEISGVDIIEGQNALVISAVPNSVREDNYSFGKIWVDENDYSILKIEWDQRSIKDFKDKVESRAGDMKRIVAWGAVYGEEKKGLRFPSRQYIEEKLVTIAGSEYTKYKVEIIYDNYKFFTVETDVIFRD
jgi:hypothetical protein